MKISFLLLLVLLLAACTQPVTPKTGDPGAIAVEGELGTPLLLANGKSTVYARIRVTPVPRPDQARGPANVVLAIDTSGSMEGDAIAQAKSAAIEMIDSLRDGDKLGVITFDTKSLTLVSPVELDAEQRALAKARIATMTAQGTTEMAGGLGLALSLAQANATPQGVNRIVLLGDGIPNTSTSIEGTARRAAESGVAVTALGLGLDYDEVLMGKIASVSGGRYRYIESADKLAVFFREEMQKINSVYARNATARITAGPGVQIDAVIGEEDRGPSQAAYVTLGDITQGDPRDILVRMTVTPRKAGVPIELLDVSVTFDDAVENAGSLERRVYLGARTVEDEAKVAAAKKPAIELAAALAEASATTLRALALAKTGQYTRARGMLLKGSSTARSQAEHTPSADLTKQATDMEAVAKDMPMVDLPAPAPTPASSGYEFQDEALRAPAAETPITLPPAAARRQKEAHQSAYDALH